MDKLEELLPGLDKFLCQTLAKEKLSGVAEKQRQYYAERLDVLKFNPPSLPPRPDTLIKFNTGGLKNPSQITSSNEDYLTSTPKGKPPKTAPPTTNGNHTADQDGGLDDNLYDDMDNLEGETYEIPIVLDTGSSNAPGAAHMTDVSTFNSTGNGAEDGHSDSGTSYESYDDDDDLSQQEPAIYENTDFPIPENVELPRIAKKKKSRKAQVPELPIKDLPDVACSGELYHKGTYIWSKRYVIISDNRLLVYKSDKDTRPLVNFVLVGYHVVYMEKDGRRNHVMRVSHQGCETHWFSTDLKEIADYWLEHLNAAAVAGEAPSSGDSITISLDVTKMNNNSSDSQSLSAAYSSSEGGSGDGVVNRPKSPRPPDMENKRQNSADKKKRSALQSFFGTFSKKKGQKVKKILDLSDFDDILSDRTAIIAGIVDVKHQTLTNNEWCQKLCAVKNGCFECYQDNPSEGAELVFPLHGVEIETAGKETKKSLAIKLLKAGQESIYIDVPDPLEQGKWLNVLIKERCASKGDGTLEVIYQNKDILQEQMEGEDPEPVYDEVFDHLFRKPAGQATDSSISSEPSNRSSMGKGSEKAIVRPNVKPPPLPNTLPPVPKTAPPRKPPISTQYPEDNPEEQYENFLEQSHVSDFSEEIDSAFSQIHANMDTDVVRGTGKASSLERHRAKVGPSQPPVSPARSSPDVVRCHTGPTIEEDQELLKKTKNPILSELKKEKGKKTVISRETIEQDIEDIRRKIITMKKQKAALRNKVLASRVGPQKDQLRKNLNEIDDTIEAAEQELTKLQLMAQEKEVSGLGRNDSFRSSFSSTSSAGSCKKPSPRIEKDKSAVSSVSSSPSKVTLSSRSRSIESSKSIAKDAGKAQTKRTSPTPKTEAMKTSRTVTKTTNVSSVRRLNGEGSGMVSKVTTVSTKKKKVPTATLR